MRAVATILLSLLLVAGCGGGGDDAADSGSDVNQLLQDTFDGGKGIKSGALDVSLGIEGGSNVTVRLTGPFESQGEGRFPKLDLDASLEGSGQSLKAGVTSTGDRGFVRIGDTSYEVSGPVFQQFKAGYEESAKKSGSTDHSLASLGIDPRRWLTNARNAGAAKVGDTDTIKITGDVDVPKLLDDVNGALEKVRALGVQGSGQLPDKLTEEEKRQTAEAIKDLSVEIYTGAEDRILRRIRIALGLQSAQAGQAEAADVRFDLQLLDVNEGQDIEAPENAKPFEELIEQFDGLDLGGLGGLGGLGSGSQGGGAADPQALEEYSRCVREAGSDSEKVRKCADLLTP